MKQIHLLCHLIFITTPGYGQELLSPFTEGGEKKQKRVNLFV